VVAALLVVVSLSLPLLPKTEWITIYLYAYVCTCIIIPRYFTVVQIFVFYPVEDSRNLKVFENSFYEIYRY